MSLEMNFESPEAVALGAIGEPGNRVFVIQIRTTLDAITLKLEKAQVAGLVRYIALILGDLDKLGHLPKAAPVVPPLEPLFVVGEIAVAYSEVEDSVTLTLTELAEDEELASKVTVEITKELAGTLAIQGTELIESGRPTCPLCGFPIEPEGHPCPRTNGYRAPKP
ncbi:MAG: DUF3090 family protein [Actinomycetota bacterium]|nr:DUF3090 family protein [Actinomycetota bacterium]